MYELYEKADFRQIITVKCPKGLNSGELKKWWFERAEKIKELPFLKWYTVNFTLDCSPFGVPAFDGFEELWFGRVNELKMAFETDIMQKGFEDIKRMGIGREECMQAAWLEENIVKLKGYKSIPGRAGMVRLTGICTQPPAMTRKDLTDWFYQHAARVIDKEGKMTIPGIRWYTHCFAIDSPLGKSKIEGCAENWWDSLKEIQADFNGEVMQSQLKDREGVIDVVDPSYFQGVWSDEYVIRLSK